MFFRKKIEKYKEPPVCVECKYYRFLDGEHSCVHPKIFFEITERSIITGEIITVPAVPSSCEFMRNWGCGRDGKLFEMKEV